MVNSTPLIVVLVMLLSLYHAKGRSVEKCSRKDCWKTEHYHIWLNISLGKEDKGIDHTVIVLPTTTTHGSKSSTTPSGISPPTPNYSNPPTTSSSQHSPKTPHGSKPPTSPSFGSSPTTTDDSKPPTTHSPVPSSTSTDIKPPTSPSPVPSSTSTDIKPPTTPSLKPSSTTTEMNPPTTSSPGPTTITTDINPPTTLSPRPSITTDINPPTTPSLGPSKTSTDFDQPTSPSPQPSPTTSAINTPTTPSRPSTTATYNELPTTPSPEPTPTTTTNSGPPTSPSETSLTPSDSKPPETSPSTPTISNPPTTTPPQSTSPTTSMDTKSTTQSGSTSSTISSTVTTTRPFDWQPEYCEQFLEDPSKIPYDNTNKKPFIPGPPFTEEEISAAVLKKPEPDTTSIRLPCTAVFPRNDSANRGVFRPNWPNAEIPYEIEDGFTQEQRALIINAIDEIENKTCLTIPVYTNQTFWMRIRLGGPDSGCYANSLGIVKEPPNIVNLEHPGCVYHGTIVHEILHVAGIDHEQKRRDRDNYVQINWENILESDDDSTYYQFCKVKTVDTGHPYDYNSVMHYGRDYFSKPPGNLITIDAKGNDIGQRDGMSQGDVDQVNYIYCNKTQECKTEWTQSDDSNKRYCFVEDEMWWYSANAYCQRFPGDSHLAILDTESKRNEVAGYLSGIGVQWAWVGASDRSGTFQWLNGNPVSNDSWYQSNVPTPDGNDDTCVLTLRFSAPKTLYSRYTCERYSFPVICEY